MSSRRIDVEEVQEQIEDFGVGVPVALALGSFALMYGLRDALVLGGAYSKLGISVIFFGIFVTAWLSGFLYARLDSVSA